MSKNILRPAIAEEVCARAEKLHPSGKGLWGSMNPAAMLYHCNQTNIAILAGRPPGKATIKQHVLRIIGLYMLRQLPKGIKSKAKAGRAEEKQDFDFRAEQSLYLETIRNIAARKEPIVSMHPVFGPLSHKEWGRFIWMHMDHHLRQFGV